MVSEMKPEAKFKICGWVGVIIIGTYTAFYIIDMFVALTNPVPFWEIMLIVIMALAYACIWVSVCRLAEQEFLPKHRVKQKEIATLLTELAGFEGIMFSSPECHGSKIGTISTIIPCEPE